MAAEISVPMLLPSPVCLEFRFARVHWLLARDLGGDFGHDLGRSSVALLGMGFSLPLQLPWLSWTLIFQLFKLVH